MFSGEFKRDIDTKKVFQISIWGLRPSIFADTTFKKFSDRYFKSYNF
jgi:hypothetical protein